MREVRGATQVHRGQPTIDALKEGYREGRCSRCGQRVLLHPVTVSVRRAEASVEQLPAPLLCQVCLPALKVGRPQW